MGWRCVSDSVGQSNYVFVRFHPDFRDEFHEKQHRITKNIQLKVGSTLNIGQKYVEVTEEIDYEKFIYQKQSLTTPEITMPVMNTSKKSLSSCGVIKRKKTPKHNPGKVNALVFDRPPNRTDVVDVVLDPYISKVDLY